MYIPSQETASEALNEFGSPLFLTDQSTIQTKAKELLSIFEGMNMKIFYAIKANYNPSLVKIIKEAGIYGIDAVSPNEVKLALDLGYSPEQIIFTPSNPTTQEIQDIADQNIVQNLGSLSELTRLGKISPGSKVSVRICPEVGAGECDKINTGNISSKFGITIEDIQEVKTICKKHNLHLVGIHSHIGSGFYDPKAFADSVQAVCDVAQKFDSVEFVDFGGGFGVQYDPSKSPISLVDFADCIKPIIEKYEQKTSKTLELRIEPGKYLVSESTVMLTKITTLKQKGSEVFVGVDSGFSNYIRPAMYEAYQHFVNISKPGTSDLNSVQIVGNVCETCDVFNAAIEINDPQEDDILAMLVAGGYGSVMSSNYNLRPTLPEVLVTSDQTLVLTKKPQTYNQIIENFV